MMLCAQMLLSIVLHWSTFHLKVPLITVSTSHLNWRSCWQEPCWRPSCHVFTPLRSTWHRPHGRVTAEPGSIPAWHSASILPAINLMFLHHQGLLVLIMTDTLRWKRLPELLLPPLLVEDLAEFPASTWRVCRKEQRGGWHQGWPAIFQKTIGSLTWSRGSSWRIHSGTECWAKAPPTHQTPGGNGWERSTQRDKILV